MKASIFYKYFVFFFSFLIFSLLFLQAKVTVYAGLNTSSDIPSTFVNSGSPRGLIVLDNGDIWYADDLNYRIVKINQSGTILRTVGRQGDMDGEFLGKPVDITRDDEGNLYVIEMDSGRIDKMDFNGGFIASWGVTEGMSLPQSIHYDAFSDSIYVTDMNNHRVLQYSKYGDFLETFGTFGSGNGQLNEPIGITTDLAGRVYVVDGSNHRIVVFNSNHDYIRSFGSVGSGDGELTYPKEIVILSNGNVAVTSQNSQKIQIFTTAGAFVSSWGTNGSTPGSFLTPCNLAKDDSDNLYVTDWGLLSIQKFTVDGVIINEIRNGSVTAGSFMFPQSIAYDSVGNLYVLDTADGSGRVQKFSNSGTYIGEVIATGILSPASYNIAIDSTDRMFIASDSEVRAYGIDGTFLFNLDPAEHGAFSLARGIDFDSLGNIYVADAGNDRIIVFDSTGAYASEWGVSGNGEGQMDSPTGIAIDADNEVFVVDHDNVRVSKFTSTGTFIVSFGYFGEGPEAMSEALYVAVDSTGDVFVTDYNGHTVLVFDNDGNFLFRFGSLGSGTDKFFYPKAVSINPITDTPTIVDGGNNRLESFAQGVKILNLISSADVKRVTDELSLTQNYFDPLTPGNDSISAILKFGSYTVSDFTIDLTADRNWEAVNSILLPDQSKSLVMNLNPINAPGISSDHALYVVKKLGQTSVIVCPDAQSIDEVSLTCVNGYELIEGDATLSTVSIGGVDYWKITGLTGTGAMSYTTKELSINVSATNVNVNQPVTITVTALNASSGTDTYYRGTIGFTSTSATAVLPSNFTFSSGDAGTYTFTDQLNFTEAGTYTVTVYDLNDNSLTATSISINVAGVTPTPTGTPTPTSTPNPTLSPTATLTLTPTPLDQSCVENQLQAKCQVAVEISSLTSTVLGTDSVRICWTTNIETKGVVYYGLSRESTYNLSSEQEESYATDHCITITGLTNNTKYIYRVSSTSPASRTGYQEGSFTIGTEALPDTGENSQCITITDNTAYSFNSLNQALLSYKTGSSATCSVDYGVNTIYGNSTAQSTGLSHTSVIDLSKLDGTSDLYYRIKCTVTGTTNQCTSKGVIPASKYSPFYKAATTTSGLGLSGIVNTFFGTPEKTSSTLATTAVAGATITAVTATVAYPQWLSYGVLWMSSRRNKKNWGIVFNSLTNEPISFAVVRAYNVSDGSFVKQSITDTQGRYGFTLDAGVFDVKVEQDGYEPFVKQITITKPEDIVAFNIPLLKTQAMAGITKIKEAFQNSLGKISAILFMVGIVLTLGAVAVVPNVFNVVVLIIYIAQIGMFLALRPPRGWGYIYNSVTDERIKGAFVRIFDVQEGRQIDVQMADQKGRFGFITDKKKDYYLRVDAQGYSFPSIKDKDDVIKLENGEVFIKTNSSEGVNYVIALDPA